MTSPAFATALNEQVAAEFAAHQQYIAIAVYFDAETLPRLASFFYVQALEERGHALMMLRYLLDNEADPVVPAVAAPRIGFADIVEPVRLALDQEREVSDQIGNLMKVARDANDYQAEQFTQWFLKEQTEEVSTMSDLLATVTRAREHPLSAEEFVARESFGATGADAGAPPLAGA